MSFADPQQWVRRIVAATVRPRPKEKMWQWIDRNVSIPVITGSPNPGPMKTIRFPIYRELFEMLQQSNVHFFTLCSSARVGKTLMSICYVLWRISERPGPVLWLDPTRKTAMRFVRSELEPFLLECPPVAAKAIITKTTWTALEKQFRGLMLRVVGSGAPTELAGYQAETIVINEADRLRAIVDREAASADLAVERSKQFVHTRMVLRNSTPTREDGYIWQHFIRGSQHYCYVRCPHCEALQRLTFFQEKKDVPFDEDGNLLPPGEVRVEETGRVKFEQFRIVDTVEVEPGKFEQRERGYDIEGVKSGATYECAKCKRDIEHVELNAMLASARWLPHNPGAPSDHVSAHLSALYSPFESWGMIADKFLQAKGNLSKMVAFHTLDLGLPFVFQGAAIKTEDLERVIRRCPVPYIKRTMPYEPELLTMTVDVQGLGFWWSIRAHGILWDHPDKPFWSALIDWGEAVSWEQIEEFAGLRADASGQWNKYRFRRADGTVQEYQVTAGLIDSGFEAQENKNVYEFCARWSEIFSPSKGGDQSKTRGATFRLSPVMNDRLDLVWYWDSFFKQGLYQHCVALGMNGAGEPLYWWLPTDIDAEYRKHMTSERLEERAGKKEWITRGDNHLADTEKMHEVLRDTIWESLEQRRQAREAEESATVDTGR